MQNRIVFTLLVLILGVSFVPVSAFAKTQARLSTNWAGHVAVNGGFEGVGATWKIPEVKKSADETAHATWVGIGGYGRKDLIQSGTIAIRKENGKLTYAAWVEILPASAKRIPVTVAPGDTVTVAMEEVADDQWEIAFTNDTTGQWYTTTLEYDSSSKTAEWIQEMPSRLNGERIPLDRFSPVTFTDTWALRNGKKISPKFLDLYRLNMVDLRRNEIAQTNALKSDGETFTVRRTKQRVTDESVNAEVKGTYYQKKKDAARVIEGNRFRLILPN